MCTVPVRGNITILLPIDCFLRCPVLQQTGAMLKPIQLTRFSAGVADMIADVLQQVIEGWTQHTPYFNSKGHKIVAQVEGSVTLALAFPGCVCSYSSGCGSVDVGAGEGVDTGGIPHHHSALPEGESCK